MATLFVLGAGFVYAVFGGALPALVGGGFAASIPVATYRARRRRRREKAQEAWPRIIEEIRILTGSLGRSVPQALFEAGLRGPDELRSGFEAAQREWLLSTDFSRTVSVLKQRLADPTADAACETLLVAHELGGGDLDRRLAELAEDRRDDAAGRKDARSKQAGVRFARRFVVIVPLGMAVAGMSLGNGRASYQTTTGQALVAVGLVLIGACWVWSGRILQLPVEERVFR
jgi:tight adherence protein B